MELADKIVKLAYYQALVCPYLTIHETETHQWDDYVWFDVGRYVEDIELVRSLKNLVIEKFIGIIDEWKNKNLSFEIALKNRYS